MSQLQNTAQVFQNNDLVTAAKLNALVIQTTITPEVITAQTASSNALTGEDVVLAYEAATGTLVKVDLDTIRSTGSGPVKTTDIENLGDADLNITNTATSRTIRLRSHGVNGTMVFDTPNGMMSFTTGTGTKSANTKFNFVNGPVVVQDSIEGVGAATGATMAVTIGSPVATFTTTGNHGLTNNEIIEIIGPTAEFSGVYPLTANGTGTFIVTFPINATVAHTNTQVTFRRPTLRVKEFTYLNRLQVVGAAKFTAGAEFSSIPVVKGTPLLSLYAIQELEMTTPWTATNAGFYNSIFTSALLTKPVNEVWVATGTFHVQTTGYPTYVGVRFSNVTAQTGQYLALNTFQDSANGATIFDYNWQFSFNIPSATTFTDLSLRLDVNASSGSAARIGHTTSFQNHFAGGSGPLWPLSRITIHKYKVA